MSRRAIQYIQFEEMEGREKVVDTAREGERKQSQEGLKQQKPTSTKSPPSASSSPSHEFSFTISVNSSSTTNTVHNKAKAPPPLAIDLSPADDIFFHGHLLPLHLLSHLPVSPRSSTNSLESFTLPIKELEDQKPNNYNTNIDSSSSSRSSSNSTKTSESTSSHRSKNGDQTKARSKSKAFSLFGLIRWRKECKLKEVDGEEKEKQKRKIRFDMNQVIKRYVRMVRRLWLFRRENIHFRRQPYSFSGTLTMREKQEFRGRRGEFSAPASMRTSPTNSGLLLATATPPNSTSDSTMEELQAAIQAAIAHCKNSIAMEEKLKC
ncbi:hypothetical protein RJ641_032206 [Dillenia turbinata]|uniref:BRI1 kinase inhibitor 1 n=1 Tax=Dillenia turbinata TaxID=194707 RepID=A0AAN8W2E9_9MAGN